jgi:hypothetical protein
MPAPRDFPVASQIHLFLRGVTLPHISLADPLSTPPNEAMRIAPPRDRAMSFRVDRQVIDKSVKLSNLSDFESICTIATSLEDAHTLRSEGRILDVYRCRHPRSIL